jgi:two-component system LytT family response regulator
MNEIEKALPTERFLMIHKSNIINFDKIKSIDGNSVVLTSRVDLPIGNSFKENFTNMINTKTLKSGRKGY